MSNFRIEVVHDPDSGLYRGEIYYPDYSLTPSAVTRSIYENHEHVMLDIVEILKNNKPDKPIKAWPKH